MVKKVTKITISIALILVTMVTAVTMVIIIAAVNMVRTLTAKGLLNIRDLEIEQL